MAILQVKPHLTIAQLKERMQKEQRVHAFKRWQILHADSHAQWRQCPQAVALLLGSTVSIVRRTVQLYNKEGADFLVRLSSGVAEEKNVA